MIRAPNLTALVGGVAIVALGVLLVLEAQQSVRLGFAYMAPIMLAALGATLLASGLARRRRD
jgi:uncharacterized membrane-anchored protein